MVEFLAHPVPLEFEAQTSLRAGDPRPIRIHVQLPHQNQVDLWMGPLDLSAFRLAEFEATLSSQELDRAQRFRFELHRHRYIAAHGWLRSVLAAYLARSAEAVEFVLSPSGKPGLSPPGNPTGLRFNLAHSENFAAIAVSKSCDVGVDIEQVRPIPDARDLVSRFFSQSESVAFHSLPEDQRSAAFFNLWTRKEAWLKATGEGIAHLLNQVEVSFLPDHPVELLKLPEGYDGDSPWSLQAIHPRPGVVVAVAAKCAPLQLRTRWADSFSEEAS
jgi:4'-phosphopantetheinyl transferase